MRIALYQPDIPQNTGAMMRLAACLGAPLDLIEPAGFLLGDRRLKRAGMDYLGALELTRHRSWKAFLESRQPRSRLKYATQGNHSVTRNIPGCHATRRNAPRSRAPLAARLPGATGCCPP